MAVKLKHGKALSMLSLTSLIDVVFLLLIFFLVATKFAEEDRLKQMPVELPSASEAKPLTHKPQDIVITVTQTGAIFIGQQEMTLTELEDYLRAAATNNPLSQTASIEGDRRASWDAIASVLNACQKYGITPKPKVDDPPPPLP